MLVTKTWPLRRQAGERGSERRRVRLLQTKTLLHGLELRLVRVAHRRVRVAHRNDRIICLARNSQHIDCIERAVHRERRELPGPAWKSTSELGYPEKYCANLLERPHHRADEVTGTASRRWRRKPSSGYVTGTVGRLKFDFHTARDHEGAAPSA